MNNKILFAFMASFLFFILSFVVVFANPVPLGVDGSVYNIKGGELFENVPVNITNVDTGEVITARTGRGSSGRFSVVLNWSVGSHVNVSVSNSFFVDSSNFTLSGMHRNVDLYLNMSIGNVAPSFISDPVVEALAGEEYSYEVEVFDWNEDVISYSLVDAPSGMSLSDNVVYWVPERYQFGNHSVVINASDGVDYSLQEFFVEVFVEKEDPRIVSEPVTSVMRGDVFEYEVEVLDEDVDFLNYSVFRGPEGMFFDGNVLTFEPESHHSGEYIIIIDVEDLLGEVVRQIFFLTVDEPRERSSRQRVFFSNVSAATSDEGSFSASFSEKGFALRRVELDTFRSLSLSVSEFSPRTEGISSLSTRTYEYFRVDVNESFSDSVSLVFSVSGSWLNDTGLGVDDIVLVRFEDRDWVELPTSFLKEDGGEFFFESIFDGLSFFGITHREDVVPVRKPMLVHEVKPSFSVFGKVLFLDNGKLVSFSDAEISNVSDSLFLEVVNKNTGDEFFLDLLVFDGSFFYTGDVFGSLGDELSLRLFYDDLIVEDTLILGSGVNEFVFLIEKENDTFLSTYFILLFVLVVFVFIHFIFKKRWLGVVR